MPIKPDFSRIGSPNIPSPPQITPAFGQQGPSAMQQALARAQIQQANAATDLTRARLPGVQAEGQQSQIELQEAQRQQSIQRQLDKAAKGGTTQYLDTLKKIDPERALKYQTAQKNIEVAQAQIAQANAGTDRERLLIQKEMANQLGGYGVAIESFGDPDIQKTMYKKALPQIKKIYPDAPDEYDPLMMKLWTAHAAAANAKSVQGQSPAGKEQADVKSGLLTPEEAAIEAEHRRRPDQPKSDVIRLPNGQIIKVPDDMIVEPGDKSLPSFKPIPGSKQARMSSDQAKTFEIARGGIAGLNKLQGVWEATKNPGLESWTYTPNWVKTNEGKKATILVEDLSDSIGRLRSGGAINAEEEARFKKLLPQMGDDQEIVEFKTKHLADKFVRLQSTMLGQNLEPEKFKPTKLEIPRNLSPEQQNIVDEAEEAISQGADPKAVQKRLDEFIGQ